MTTHVRSYIYTSIIIRKKTMKLSEMKLAKSMGAAILGMYKMSRETRIEKKLLSSF